MCKLERQNSNIIVILNSFNLTVKLLPYFNDLLVEFHDFSITTVIFHDFPGLENSFLKFHDFPGHVETLRPVSNSNGNTSSSVHFCFSLISLLSVATLGDCHSIDISLQNTKMTQYICKSKSSSSRVGFNVPPNTL